MAVEFPCQQCQSNLRIEVKDSGKKARCPRCGMIQAVPASALEPTADASSSDGPNVNSPTSEDADHDVTVYRPATATGEALDSKANDSTSSADKLPTENTGPNQDSGNDKEIEILADNVSMLRWSMKTPDGTVYGPVERQELDNWAAQGRVSSQCLVQPEGETRWRAAITLYPHLAGLRQTGGTTTAARQAQPVQAERYRFVDNTTLGQPENYGIFIFLLSLFGLCLSYFPVISLAALIWAFVQRQRIKRGEIRDNAVFMINFGIFLSLLSVAIFLFGISSFFLG